LRVYIYIRLNQNFKSKILYNRVIKTYIQVTVNTAGVSRNSENVFKTFITRWDNREKNPCRGVFSS
jgi:hypothetical protein